MKIVVRAFWDDEAEVWVAEADGETGLVTEADTLELLHAKLPVLAADLLELEASEPVEIELISRTIHNVAAE